MPPVMERAPLFEEDDWLVNFQDEIQNIFTMLAQILSLRNLAAKGIGRNGLETITKREYLDFKTIQ